MNATLEECFVMGQDFPTPPPEPWPDNVVPPMADPLGKHWRQPDPSTFIIDNSHVLMTQAQCDALAEYSTTLPSGVYPGKMWKAKMRNYTEWWLVWFGYSDKGADWCSNNYRRILIA